jgi:NAD(P)-dependent dehydrogenase (short-subunit alcohol dehydrogenase family)
MKARRWGRILNVASIFGVVSREGRGAYSATKSGIIGFTRTFALEMGPHNILVNALCPGYVETELTRQNNGPAQLEMLAAQIRCAASPRPRRWRVWRRSVLGGELVHHRAGDPGGWRIYGTLKLVQVLGECASRSQVLGSAAYN